MNAVVKKHLPVIIAVTLLGFITACLAFSWLHASATGMNVAMFSWLVFLIPCIIMLICTFIIGATATQIGRQLYVVVLAICLVTGVISMFISSSWMSDSAIASALIANSEEGTTLIPVLQSPMTILRDVAAFIVMPTVGIILGAWVGSKLHPLQGEKTKKDKSKKNKR